MNTMPSASRQMNHPPTGSIILEYANEREQNACAYNEPHTIHLDTAAFFQNSRGSGSKLIEISSDSEDTTDTDTDTSESGTDTESESGSESGSETESVSDLAVKNNTEVVAVEVVAAEAETEAETEAEAIDVIQIDPTEIKTVSVDLGTMQEPEIQSKEKPSMELYKKSQETSSSVVEESLAAPAPAPAPASAPIPLAAMSVNDLKALLKEKCKNQPEKHAEIQRLKKAELIYAIQQLV